MRWRVLASTLLLSTLLSSSGFVRGPMRQLYTEESSAEFVHHINTQLSDGRPAILVDLGSVGNLCGDKWAEKVAKSAKRALALSTRCLSGKNWIPTAWNLTNTS